jgi:hypothetical protein
MPTRPLKEGSVTTYQQKVALGFPDILASEMDADLDTIYAAWNGGVNTANLVDGSVTTPKLANAPNGVTTAKLNDGAVTWAKFGGDQTFARVYRAANAQVIATGTFTALTFDTVVMNQGGLYNTGANDRFTVAPTGVYVFGASVEIDTSAAGARRMLLLNVGATAVAATANVQRVRREAKQEAEAVMLFPLGLASMRV